VTDQGALDLDLESPGDKTRISEIRDVRGVKVKYIYDEFWTARQRQAKALHEVSYRACFKPQLPEYFISRLTNPGDTVYDPFAGRGTTAIQAALMGRSVVQNDINPLSKILTEPRLHVPSLSEIAARLEEIDFGQKLNSDIDLTMFFEEQTLNEILSLRNYMAYRREEDSFDPIDKWIAMVATNRLTGHSPGFFSVYSFPPNIAVSQQSQIRINEKRKQKPTYRDTKAIILKKSKSLQALLSVHEKENLRNAAKKALFLSQLASDTKQIQDSSIKLTVTSPPFLDIVQYSEDNWMRCWFNGIDSSEVGKKITMSKTTLEWSRNMQEVIQEVHRITQRGGHLAFEVGEIRNQSVKLDDLVIPLGISAGFEVIQVLINVQDFTKTSNLWGVSNNSKGTNTNRIVLMRKP
jgi:hypothetical protein